MAAVPSSLGVTTGDDASVATHVEGGYHSEDVQLIAIARDSAGGLPAGAAAGSKVALIGTVDGALYVASLAGGNDGLAMTAGFLASRGLTGASRALGVIPYAMYGNAGGVNVGDQLRTPGTFRLRLDGAVTINTPVAIWTPAASTKFRIMGVGLSLSVAGQIVLQDGVTNILVSPQLTAGGQWILGAGHIGNGILSALANNVLNFYATASGNVGGMVWGTQEV